MKSVCRSIGIGWLCTAMLVGSGLAQQNDPAAKADAERKAAAAKAAGADIEKLQAARAALAAQRERRAQCAKEPGSCRGSGSREEGGPSALDGGRRH